MQKNKFIKILIILKQTHFFIGYTGHFIMITNEKTNLLHVVQNKIQNGNDLMVSISLPISHVD